MAAQTKGAGVEVWSFDEHRLGLQPIIRRVWTKVGGRPIAPVHPRYEWFYLYGFVHPSSGRTHWVLLPQVNHKVLSIALKLFADAVGVGAERQVVLVLDQARWHTTSKVVVPEGVHLEFLPPYSPELQPAERLWSLTDQPFFNRAIETITRMEDIASQRCRYLMDHAKDLIRGLTSFHWWPPDVPPKEAPI